MYILGINAYHGNASAAIVADGRLIAAVEEERFNRVKYAAGFPSAAIRYCLDAAGITLREVDHIAIPRNPWARLGTKLLYALRMPSFAGERAKVMARFAGIPEALAKAFDVSPERDSSQVSPHRASPGAPGEHVFRFSVRPGRAAVRGRARRFRQHDVGDRPAAIACTSTDAIAFPHSLGMYYTAVSQYLGFRKFGDEYKVMGLAAYGEPAYWTSSAALFAPTEASASAWDSNISNIIAPALR